MRRTDEREQYLADFGDLLDAAAGRRFLYVHLACLGTFGVLHTGEQTHATAAQAGRQNAGKELLMDCFEAAPRQASDMLARGLAQEHGGDG